MTSVAPLPSDSGGAKKHAASLHEKYACCEKDANVYEMRWRAKKMEVHALGM
jgi:hypothetical protein